jgi:hypothetical protein
MTLSKVLICCCTIVVFWRIPVRAVQHPTGEPPSTSLEALMGRTGWIHLGDLTADGKAWGTRGDPAVDFPAGVFEIVGERLDRHKPILPTVGDRIRLPVRTRVYILDYGTQGEKRRLEPLSALGDRNLGPDDQTRIVLAAGAIVEVRAVDVWEPEGAFRGAYARVVPAKK